MMMKKGNNFLRGGRAREPEYQKNPRPFVWTVDADEILRKVAKLRRLEATGQ